MTDQNVVTVSECGAVAVGYRWWSAAWNNETNVMSIGGPIDAAHLALARDAAAHAVIELSGERGTCSVDPVLLDGDDEPVALVGPDAPDDDWVPAGWAKALPVVIEDDLPQGALELDDVLPFEGTVWDGHNHVSVNATESRDYVADRQRREEDGHVTWVFDDDGGGEGEGLADVEIDEGWEQLDYYATNGYGNESSTYNIDDEDAAERIVEELSAAGIPAERSLVTDGASNEPAEAVILVAPEYPPSHMDAETALTFAQTLREEHELPRDVILAMLRCLARPEVLGHRASEAAR